MADKTPCECSKFDTLPEDLTEEQIETGDFESFDTGCQAETARTFAPGHDAKLKSALIKWGALGLEVRKNEGGMAVSGSAESWAAKYDFGHMVIAGIAKAREKAEAKATRKAAKAAAPKKAERKLAEDAGLVHDGNEARREREQRALTLAQTVQAEEAAHAEAVKAEQAEREATADWTDEADAPKTVTAKIGRWEYQGTVADNGTFWYTDKKGNSKMAKEGEYKLV